MAQAVDKNLPCFWSWRPCVELLVRHVARLSDAIDKAAQVVPMINWIVTTSFLADIDGPPTRSLEKGTKEGGVQSLIFGGKVVSTSNDMSKLFVVWCSAWSYDILHSSFTKEAVLDFLFVVI